MKFTESTVEYATLEWFQALGYDYVPPDPVAGPLFLHWNDYADVSKRRKLERKLKKRNTLPVPADDVMYLILPPEKDEQNVMKLYPRRRDAILVATTIMTTD